MEIHTKLPTTSTLLGAGIKETLSPTRAQRHLPSTNFTHKFDDSIKASFQQSSSVPTSMSAFVTSTCVSPSLRNGGVARVCLRRVYQPLSPKRVRKAMVNMCEQKTNTEGEEPLTPTEEDQQTPVSFWGVASFAIILGIFMIGIVATIARDFIPGGMVGPA